MVLTYLLAIGHLAIGFSVIIDPFYIYTSQLALAARLNLFIFAALCLPAGYLLIRAYGVTGGALFLGAVQLTAFIHIVVILRHFHRQRQREADVGGGVNEPSGDGSSVS